MNKTVGALLMTSDKQNENLINKQIKKLVSERKGYSCHKWTKSQSKDRQSFQGKPGLHMPWYHHTLLHSSLHLLRSVEKKDLNLAQKP